MNSSVKGLDSLPIARLNRESKSCARREYFCRFRLNRLLLNEHEPSLTSPNELVLSVFSDSARLPKRTMTFLPHEFGVTACAVCLIKKRQTSELWQWVMGRGSAVLHRLIWEGFHFGSLGGLSTEAVPSTLSLSTLLPKTTRCLVIRRRCAFDLSRKSASRHLPMCGGRQRIAGRFKANFQEGCTCFGQSRKLFTRAG